MARHPLRSPAQTSLAGPPPVRGTTIWARGSSSRKLRRLVLLAPCGSGRRVASAVSPQQPLATGAGATLIATRLLRGAMPGPGRNDPCPCGSGRKVKRCCEQQRGPSEEPLARAHLALLARDAAGDIGRLPDDALRDLWEALVDLPATDLTRRAAQADWPRPATPARPCQRRRPRLGHRGADPRCGRDRHVPATSATRRRARAAARSSAHHAFQAAVAILELDSSSTRFVDSSLIEAIALAAGAIPTSGGVQLAA